MTQELATLLMDKTFLNTTTFQHSSNCCQKIVLAPQLFAFLTSSSQENGDTADKNADEDETEHDGNDDLKLTLDVVVVASAARVEVVSAVGEVRARCSQSRHGLEGVLELSGA